MKATALALTLLAAAALPAAAPAEDLIEVPSGQAVSLYDTVSGEPGPGGLTVRFRFLAPGIAREKGEIAFETAQADMAHLCETYVLPRLSDIGPRVAQVVVTLMDRPVPFGATMPEATQFFEAYRPEDGHCVWEGF